MLVFEGVNKAIKDTGLTYIGRVNNGSKHKKAYKYNELVYTIYLAPANMSGYEVCGGSSAECRNLCLNESGHNRMDIKLNKINNSRIIKTRLIFEQKEFITRWIIHEIQTGINRAKKIGYNFSVRLNNTSDISPEDFYVIENGIKRNILEIFPNVMFYDYTKIPNRRSLMKKYENYDITFSYNGFNMFTCLNMLKSGVRVAMVFKTVPETYKDYKVINGDLYDMRYKDEKNVIVGLKYKKVRNKLDINSKFVIQ